MKKEVIENDSPELLAYKLQNSKSENRKNIIIAILVTAIVMFTLGFMISFFVNKNASALTEANAKIQVENVKLSTENDSLKAQIQK
jgi:flagellar basal body-associated protein FliL